jgi:hypothetical protein
MIQTKSTIINYREFRSVLFSVAIRRSKLLGVLFVLIMLTQLPNHLKSETSVSIYVITILYLPLTYLSIHSKAAVKELNGDFTEFELSFDENQVTFRQKKGVYFEIPYRYIKKIANLRKHYLVYASNWFLIIVPKEAFKNSDDVKKFEELFKNQLSQGRKYFK